MSLALDAGHPYLWDAPFVFVGLATPIYEKHASLNGGKDENGKTVDRDLVSIRGAATAQKIWETASQLQEVRDARK